MNISFLIISFHLFVSIMFSFLHSSNSSVSSFVSQWFGLSHSFPTPLSSSSSSVLYSTQETDESASPDSSTAETLPISPSSSALYSSSPPSLSPSSYSTASTSTPFTPEETTKLLASCDKMREKSLYGARRVGYMIRSLALQGCEVDPADFVRCVICPLNGVATAFFEVSVGKPSAIGLCANSLKKQDDFDTILTHELIHAYDFCRAEINPNNLSHVACTEIRAANLSGDCTFMREWRRGKGNVAISNHHNKCVKRRTFMSISGHSEVKSREQAHKIIEDLWEKCSKDYEPFGSIPW